MRILTWNLDHGRVWDEQRRLIDQQHIDVAVLTEIPEALSLSADDWVVSPCERPAKGRRESWVGIYAPGAATAAELPLERMAAAATAVLDGIEVIVYGSVLPWNGSLQQAPYLARGATSVTELFERLVAEQVEDMLELRRGHPRHALIWAGDFNQPLVGTNSGFSNHRRRVLREALDHLGLVAWNEAEPHQKPTCSTIDLICGPHDWIVRTCQRVPAPTVGATISDHDAYLVDVSTGSP